MNREFLFKDSFYDSRSIAKIIFFLKVLNTSVYYFVFENFP